MSVGGYSQFYKSASADNLTQLGSDDDLSKHSKVKRLSLETNRRRRELASRLKKEAEKEEKRKKEILEQRREKQRQATEKFQRCFSARTRRSPTRPRSPGRAQTSELDAMLHLIRTGAPLHRVSSWDSVRHHAWPSAADAADPWLNGVAATGVPDSPAASPAFTRPSSVATDKPPLPVSRRTLFEQQLAERQERLAMDQCRTLAEFSQVVESCVDEAAPADSLDEEASVDSEAPGVEARPAAFGNSAPGVVARPAAFSNSAPGVEDGDMETLLDDSMFRPQVRVTSTRTSEAASAQERREPPITHFRFVVERQEAPEEETLVEDLENGSVSDAPSVKSILKKKSAYSPEHRGARSVSSLANGLSGEALRDSIEITRVHMEHKSPPETPQPTRRKTVRFAEQLCEELKQSASRAGDRVVGDIPSPKPRRIYGTYASGATAPAQGSGYGGAVALQKTATPTAASRLTVTRRVAAKPPQHPNSGSPGRPGAKPEKITTATLSRVVPSTAKEKEEEAESTKSPPATVVTVIPSANQPTLVISSSPAPPDDSASAAPAAQLISNGPAVHRSPPQPSLPVSEASDVVPLDRTPTEADIEWLWAKVRSCLQRPGSGTASVAGSVGEDSQTNSELSIQSAPARPVVPMSSQVIDGTSIYPPNLARNHYRISRQDSPNARLIHHHNVSPHARRVALIRQREMNQHLSRAVVNNNNTGDASQMPGSDQSMTDSMAEFLANEQLCQQSHLFSNSGGSVPVSSPSGNQGLLNPVMSSLLSTQESIDSRRGSNPQVSPTSQNSRQPPSPSLQSRRRVFMREQYKPNSLQQHTAGTYTFTPHPPPARRASAGPNGGKRLYPGNGYRPMSTLSVEEQRLMKSLERINDKLKTTTLTK